jgi:serine/threonine-protein kinase
MEEKIANGIYNFFRVLFFGKIRERGYIRNFFGILFIFAIGFAIFFTSSILMMIAITKSGKNVKVPNVRGDYFETAYKRLSDLGFKVEIKLVDGLDVPRGYVIEQYPKYGEVVKEGSKIRLTVSRGKYMVIMPNLVGLKLEDAKLRLKNIHTKTKTIELSVKTISYIPSKKYPLRGVVIDQEPSPGELIPSDRKVNLLVSSGETYSKYYFGDYRGQFIDVIAKHLEELGVNVITKPIFTDKLELSGIIKEQKPKAGFYIKKGDKVIFEVYYAKTPVRLRKGYELFSYDVPADGVYTIFVRDDTGRRIRYSKQCKAGEKIELVFKRVGPAVVEVYKDGSLIKEINYKLGER